MFILRKISGSGLQMNFALGKSYNYITTEDADYFKRLSKSVYGKDAEDIIYAFITDENGKPHPLSCKQKAYIMTGGGETFANVCDRR